MRLDTDVHTVHSGYSIALEPLFSLYRAAVEPGFESTVTDNRCEAAVGGKMVRPVYRS